MRPDEAEPKWAAAKAGMASQDKLEQGKRSGYKENIVIARVDWYNNMK